MTQCLNPSCLKQNPDHSKFCSYCRTQLLLSDRYRAVKYIGEGAFGRTFLAVDQHRLDSSCVIKQFLPLQQGKAFELFKQEAQLLMSLGKNPQIPDLLAFFEQESRFYLIQEYVEGQDLQKILLQKKYFSEAEVTNFLTQLLPVLQYIHDHKVIHRDIKLDNIILKNSASNTPPLLRGAGGNQLVLIDFGVSKQLSTTIMTKLGTIAGTPGYASPEQMRGLVDNTSDLYALAVCGIRMLTGCLPEERDGSIVDEIFDIAEFEWVWEKILQQKNMTVSNHLRAILNKMLQDKMKERFQSATEVLQALTSTTGFQPVLEPDTGKMPVLPRSSNSKSYTENLGNNITLDMISIPGGSFMMGSNENDSEKPIHKVTLQPFFMGKYQVTQAQWRVIANRNDLKVKIDLKPDPSKFKGDQLPVEQVNWYEAVEYCDRLSKLTGRQYKLSSEAQWEYACRAGTQSRYYFGDDENKLGEYAWYDKNSGSQTHVVGQKTPNNFGLYDMHGNVWEWCLDDWHSNYSGAPNDGSAWSIEKDSQQAVLRGGAWCGYYDYCRCAFRFYLYYGRDNHYNLIGFRVVGVVVVRT